jgi:hypothetical protein
MCFIGFRDLDVGDLKDMESLSSNDHGIEEYYFSLGESVGHAQEE